MNFKLWTLAIMMCQCRLTYCNKCTTVMKDMSNRKVCGGWSGEDGVYRNSVLSAKFLYESKTTLKIFY